MFRLRHSLLVLPLLALLLSAVPAYAALMISDTQLTPVLIGPVQSLDRISYVCTPDNTSPSIIGRYWPPGYEPLNSEDMSDGPTDKTEPQTVSADGLPHGYNNTTVGTNFIFFFKGPASGYPLCYYEFRLKGFHTTSQGSFPGYGYGGIHNYPWYMMKN